METCKTIAIHQPGGIPCTKASLSANTHTHAHAESYTHTHFFSLSACSATYQGTKVRERHLMLKDLTHAHCSTFGTVFVATLDNLLLYEHMHKHIFSS